MIRAFQSWEPWGPAYDRFPSVTPDSIMYALSIYKDTDLRIISIVDIFVRESPDVIRI